MSKKYKNRFPVQQKRPQQPKVRSALVDIVIPVLGRFDLLEKCLNALPEAADGIDYNVFIFDNASKPEDKVKFYTQLHDERIYILESEQNIGYPRACNEATKVGNSPLVLQLNDDVILEPGSLRLLCMEMDDPTVGVCGMKLKFPDDVGELNSSIRPAGRLQHICLSINIRGEIHHPFMAWDINHPKVNALKNVWGVTGAALMTRRHLWNKVGGYDIAYGLGTFEDASLCMSIRELGYNIITCPRALGTHYTGATAESQKIAYPLRQNYLTFLSKWQSKLQWEDWKIL